ncbi:hypothetical protein CANINC_001359 [Pichia inconspicua]|uniref:Rad21/Rec8-like protein N-terminal domain-containing protein n=1 Tax=Pichia inconspicua TaxID=52247 RepID=A0A4T0X4B1_9ASCO|nr:hypothetical protein CANINC_001359 [[Candida] inconspicua]
MEISVGNRENLLSAVWLLATLNGDGARKPGKKNVTKIDIVETCQCIIDVSETLNLRRTSNLMYGTVLAYKSKCLWNWKEVNSCRMLIRRLGMMTTKCGVDTLRDNGDNGKGNGGIKLLADDPKFDIMFGLVEEFVDIAPNQNGSKGKYAFEKMMSGSDSDESENTVSKERPVSTQEKWDEADLDFQFDASGNVIQLKGENDVENTILSEAEIRNSFVDFNAFDELPEFEINYENDVPVEPQVQPEPAVPEHSTQDLLITPPATKRRKTGKSRQPARKRLVFDIDTCFTGVQLRDIRDGYIVGEKKKLEERYLSARKIEWENELKGLADITRYNNGFARDRGEDKEEEERDDNDRLPSFEDIEYGRERMESRLRSRSSSVSSVEIGRRAVDSRNSSSFRFDFSQREGDNTANVADIAQMDISFGLDNLGEFDDISSVGRPDIESFEEEIGDGDGTARFSVLTFGNNAKEVSCKFMFVLELATKNRARVSQDSLFGEIYIELK